MKKRIFDFIFDFIKVHTSFLNNLFFLLNIFFEFHFLKRYTNRKPIYLLKTLIIFLNQNDYHIIYDNYYRLYDSNLDTYWLFYKSMKEKNSTIFQVIIFFYCTIIEDYLLPLLNTFLFYKVVYNEMIYQRFFKKLEHLINNNFNYNYVREYSNYNYYDNKVLLKVTFWETLLNISLFINYYFGNLRKRKYIINTDYLFYKCERYY